MQPRDSHPLMPKEKKGSSIMIMDELITFY